MIPCAAVLAALIAGCGSLTKADFVARAGAICTGALRAERSLAPPSFAGSSAVRRRAFDAYLRRVLTIIASEDRQLRALPPPAQSSRDGARLDAFLSAVHTSVVLVRNLVTPAASSQIVALSNAALSALPVSRLAAAYGLSACATPAPTIR